MSQGSNFTTRQLDNFTGSQRLTFRIFLNFREGSTIIAEDDYELNWL